MEDTKAVNNQANAQAPPQKESWKAPELRELDARHTKLSSGAGADGGGENTSAS